MSPETFTQQWTQIRQQLRGWWDQLTERDLEQIAGQYDQLVRMLQERYQYTRERAQDEVDRRLQAYQTIGSPMAKAITTAAQDAAARLTETAETVRAHAAEAASTAAAAVTDTVQGAGAALQTRSLDQLAGQPSSQQTLLVKTLLVNSKTRAKAVLHPMYEDQRNRGHSPGEIHVHDLPNRVCSDAVWPPATWWPWCGATPWPQC